MSRKKLAMIFTFFCFTIRYVEIGTTVNAEKIINADDKTHEKAANKNIEIEEIVWLN
jgi:hypothetical protein